MMNCWNGHHLKQRNEIPAKYKCICVICLTGVTCIAGRMLYFLTHQHFFSLNKAVINTHSMRFNTKFTVITGTQDLLIVKLFFCYMSPWEKYIYFTKLDQWLYHQKPITFSMYIHAAITDICLHCFSSFVLLMRNIVHLISTNLISASCKSSCFFFN